MTEKELFKKVKRNKFTLLFTYCKSLKRLRGRLAQLVEHLVYTERVIGSSPLPPTIKFHDCGGVAQFG